MKEVDGGENIVVDVVVSTLESEHAISAHACGRYERDRLCHLARNRFELNWQ